MANCAARSHTRSRLACLAGAACAWLGAACVSPRLVDLDNLDVLLPPPAPASGWRAETAALLEHYERSPVLAPADERLEPLFGGLTTLSFFGANAEERVTDQRIASPGPAPGWSLPAACAAPTEVVPDLAQVTSDLPRFVPVWLPLMAAGGSAPELGSCGERGEPAPSSLPNARDSAPADRGAIFCLFARLALQPEAGRPLIVVVHGIFDSGAQAYVQHMAAVLYRLGYSVLLPDMRDHGETLRAGPEIATALGGLEGHDLLALVHSARSACGARIGRVGLLGVSGGGLDAIRAFTLDRERSLDAGVIAISPLLDVQQAIADLRDSGACPLTRSVELSWQDDLVVTLLGGVSVFAGAALVQALQGERLNGSTAIAGAIGAGAGLLGSAVVDAWFDGGTDPCLAEHSIARIVGDALRVRWRNLQAPGLGSTMSPAGRRIHPEAIDIAAYVRERAQFRAAALGVRWLTFDPVQLANDLQAGLAGEERHDARLLVLGADDDPMTRKAALHDFIHRTRTIPQIYGRAVRHGGHGALWLVQPTVMKQIVDRFFGAVFSSSRRG